MSDKLQTVATHTGGEGEPPLPVVIVGAGISGLAAATFLDGHVPLLVLEAGARAGGNVQSDSVDGRVLDRAANGWLDNEPAMGRLLDRVGLTEQVVSAGPKASVRWIWADGSLHAAPLSPPALARSSLVGTGAKLRLLLEPFLGRGPADVDETVGAFVRRRLGPAFVERLVGPMVAGIYAADPDELSLRAAFERMYQLEQEHRSLILAALKLRRGGAPPGHLQTVAGGAGALTAHLAARLGDQLLLETPATSLEQRRGRWRVHTPSGAVDARAVILACPAPAQARLTRGVDSDAAAALDAIPMAPVAVVASAWPKGAWDRQPDGFGVLHARGAAGAIDGAEGVLGTLFTSCVFPAQGRSDEVLLRTILGGAVAPEVAALDDQQLIARVRRALSAMFGQERADPALVRVFRHPAGIPQYTVGHLQRVASVRAAQARHQGLYFVGNHLQGIGVKDCAREGEKVAGQVRAYCG